MAVAERLLASDSSDAPRSRSGETRSIGPARGGRPRLAHPRFGVHRRARSAGETHRHSRSFAFSLARSGAQGLRKGAHRRAGWCPAHVARARYGGDGPRRQRRTAFARSAHHGAAAGADQPSTVVTAKRCSLIHRSRLRRLHHARVGRRPSLTLLGRLGDQRAIPLLYGALAFVRKPSADDEGLGLALEDDRAHLAAARALARLGDQGQVPKARSWAASIEPSWKVAGVSVLLASGAPDARSMLVPLLSGATSRDALELAYATPGPELVPALAQLAAAPDDWKVAVWTLGEIGGKQAVATLGALMNDPVRTWDAAFALARAPGDEARIALEAAQSNPRLRRIAARAGTVRALALRDQPRGLIRLLRELMTSKDASDRAAGAYGLAALRETSVRDLVASSDLFVVRAAARASILLGTEGARACAERLPNERDAATRAALAIALVSDQAARAISTDQLAEWGRELDQPFAPLAVVALGSREEPGTERRLGRMLTSPDPVLRGHAAFGPCEKPIAERRLAAHRRLAFRRRRIGAPRHRGCPVTATGAASERPFSISWRSSIRTSKHVKLLGWGFSTVCPCPWIVWAPDARAAMHRWERATSRAARTLRARPLPHRAWAGSHGRWLDSSGLALPLVTDPDGALVVAGVSPGDASFDLASSPFWYDALQDDAAEAKPAAR